MAHCIYVVGAAHSPRAVHLDVAVLQTVQPMDGPQPMKIAVSAEARHLSTERDERAAAQAADKEARERTAMQQRKAAKHAKRLWLARIEARQ
jgi:hypothetical protein